MCIVDLFKLKNDLTEKYSYKIELHAHTRPVSACSEITTSELVHIYKNIGFDAVVLTNHFGFNEKFTKTEYIKRYMNDFYEAEQEGIKVGVKVYLGAELRFTENYNDYLLFGVNEKILEEIWEYLPFGAVNFRKEYKMPNSAFIQAHPMRDGNNPISSEYLDGVEVFNMLPKHNSRIGLAAHFAKKEKISLITVGSDFHNLNKNYEGLSALRTDRLPDDSFDLAKILKSGNYLAEIGNSLIMP